MRRQPILSRINQPLRDGCVFPAGTLAVESVDYSNFVLPEGLKPHASIQEATNAAIPLASRCEGCLAGVGTPSFVNMKTGTHAAVNCRQAGVPSSNSFLEDFTTR
jgi:hypothetical protein